MVTVTGVEHHEFDPSVEASPPSRVRRTADGSAVSFRPVFRIASIVGRQTNGTDPMGRAAGRVVLRRGRVAEPGLRSLRTRHKAP